MKKAAIIIIIALLILVVAVGTVIVFLLMPSKPEVKGNNGYVYSTGGDFLTNLKDGGHYVKADILIEVSDKNTLKILEANNYKIRDQIIEILSNIEEEDTKHQDFKKNLRDTLKEDLQNSLKIDKIRGIYFNEFIIQ